MKVIITENQFNKLIETIDKLGGHNKSEHYIGAWGGTTQNKSDIIRLIKLAVDRLGGKMGVEQLYDVLVLLLNKERNHTSE